MGTKLAKNAEPQSECQNHSATMSLTSPEMESNVSALLRFSREDFVFGNNSASHTPLSCRHYERIV